jgi:starch synthase (maltosyl-transferring)
MRVTEGRRRVAIENVQPEIDCGRFPIKRSVGETVVVEADVFADGHDLVACALQYRRQGETAWTETRMTPLLNDRYRGEFPVGELGRVEYTLSGWIDRFGTWRRDLSKKIEAGQDVAVDLEVGARLPESAARRANGQPGRDLRAFAKRLRGPDTKLAVETALSEGLRELMDAYPDRKQATSYGRQLSVTVDRERARFGAWYELFPRSTSTEPGRHGTFKDLEERLTYVAALGFDVAYLPPVHPIGESFRKGRNNALTAGAGDPGSPWAIGNAEEGGHKAPHPDLGTLEDFESMVKRAGELGLEIAMDLAYQTSPDHPYAKDHPEWFRQRPDGSIQYAENPPKKYQDIYPLDFESESWQELWQELKSVVEFWIEQGIRIFRVDNPHTKSFAFWEWLLDELKAEHPDLIFLSEAFTRPKVMYRLAKLGFDQSYTYFTWRSSKWELTQYFSELTQTEVVEFFRPNLWPNTPDILTEQLQTGGRSTFVSRLILAATLGANYGIYGPAFELMESRPLQEGREEYLDSEKYQVRHWDVSDPNSLSELIAKVNRIRRQNPALQQDRTLKFHQIDNEALIAYSKRSADGSNFVLVVVNLDPHLTQTGWVHLPLDDFEVDPQQTYQVHDLITEQRFQWHGEHNFVELNPNVMPAHVFRVRQRVRTEQDFEYFL